jgi:SAM-dependent methyltransferase
MANLIKLFVDHARQLKEKGADTFFTSFDGGKNFSEAQLAANSIFTKQILPFAQKYLEDLPMKTSLDIGYGSGFQVACASEFFSKSDGIDVHNEFGFVMQVFSNKSIGRQMELLSSEAANMPYNDQSFDFVHSWVTFLHFPTIEYVEQVVREIYRVLTFKGVAVIYYPRLVKSKRRETIEEYNADVERELQNPLGYDVKESLTDIAKAGITIAKWKMTELAASAGFELLEHTASHDEGFIYGQHGIVLRRPEFVKPVQTQKIRKNRLVSRKKKSTQSE